MENTIKILKEKHGYKEYPQDIKRPEFSFQTLLQKKVESNAVCETNDSLSININVSKIENRNFKYEGYEIEIVAEKKSKWWKLSCYSLNKDEILSEIKQVETDLIAVFNCL